MPQNESLVKGLDLPIVWLRTPKSDRTAADSDNQTLESEFAVAGSKITIRREGGKVVVSVPVRFYRRNGRQMILADSIESETDLDESGLPNNALLTAIAKAYSWQDQLESAWNAPIFDPAVMRVRFG